MEERAGSKKGDTNPRSFVIVGLGGVFAFASSFLTISNLLGGGWFGVGISVGLSLVTVTILSVAWPRILKRSVAETPVNEEVCDPGPHVLEPRGRGKILLRVRKNYEIRGHTSRQRDRDSTWES